MKKTVASVNPQASSPRIYAFDWWVETLYSTGLVPLRLLGLREDEEGFEIPIVVVKKSLKKSNTTYGGLTLKFPHNLDERPDLGNGVISISTVSREKILKTQTSNGKSWSSHLAEADKKEICAALVEEKDTAVEIFRSCATRLMEEVRRRFVSHDATLQVDWDEVGLVLVTVGSNSKVFMSWELGPEPLKTRLGIDEDTSERGIFEDTIVKYNLYDVDQDLHDRLANGLVDLQVAPKTFTQHSESVTTNLDSSRTFSWWEEQVDESGLHQTSTAPLLMTGLRDYSTNNLTFEIPLLIVKPALRAKNTTYGGLHLMFPRDTHDLIEVKTVTRVELLDTMGKDVSLSELTNLERKRLYSQLLNSETARISHTMSAEQLRIFLELGIQGCSNCVPGVYNWEEVGLVLVSVDNHLVLSWELGLESTHVFEDRIVKYLFDDSILENGSHDFPTKFEQRVSPFEFQATWWEKDSYRSDVCEFSWWEEVADGDAECSASTAQIEVDSVSAMRDLLDWDLPAELADLMGDSPVPPEPKVVAQPESDVAEPEPEAQRQRQELIECTPRDSGHFCYEVNFTM